MALQALATVAALTSSHDVDLAVRVNTDGSTAVAVFHVDQDNFLLHQSQQVGSSPTAQPSKVAHLKLAPSPFRSKQGRGCASR